MTDTTSRSDTTHASVKPTFPTMTAMGIGGMVGAGVFSLRGASPRRPASWAPIAWVIAGTAC